MSDKDEDDLMGELENVLKSLQEGCPDTFEERKEVEEVDVARLMSRLNELDDKIEWEPLES
jgi:hypothetical protein